LTATTLAKDQVLIRRIVRIQKSRAAAREDPDSDMEDANGQDADRSILLPSSPGGGAVHDDDHKVRAPTRRAKTEPETQRSRFQSQPPRSSAVVDLMEEDDDDDEEDD
jgi:hypothetical protein